MSSLRNKWLPEQINSWPRLFLLLSTPITHYHHRHFHHLCCLDYVKWANCLKSQATPSRRQSPRHSKILQLGTTKLLFSSHCLHPIIFTNWTVIRLLLSGRSVPFKSLYKNCIIIYYATITNKIHIAMQFIYKKNPTTLERLSSLQTTTVSNTSPIIPILKKRLHSVHWPIVCARNNFAQHWDQLGF